jgi:type I restriction enzyme S subunit
MNRKYQSYKQTGVEWIGEIPSHWDFIKTNILTQNLDGKRVPLNSEERGEMEGEYPYWGSNGIVDYVNQFIFNEEIVLVGEDGSPFFDKLKDVSFYVNEPVWVNNHIHILKPKERILPRYLTHSFNCVDYKEYITGSTRDKLTQSDLKRISHCVPPLQEQQQIIQFLDEKTELIDKLISTKERKITLLKEQRTTLINQVVTKGLNPNVKMKDSGVEWIGEIPEGWKKSKVKYVSTIFGRIGYRGYTVEDIVSEGEGVITISPSNIKNDIFTIEGENTFLTYEKYEESPEIQIFPKDIILVKTGSTIGKTSIIPSEVPQMTINPQLVVLKEIKIENKYFYYQTVCEFFKKSFLVEQTGSSTPTISQEKINGFPILIPPYDEQNQIVDFLDSKTKEIDDLVHLEQRKIDLLKEYRQSLISEVVTGKIKVTQ